MSFATAWAEWLCISFIDRLNSIQPSSFVVPVAQRGHLDHWPCQCCSIISRSWHQSHAHCASVAAFGSQGTMTTEELLPSIKARQTYVPPTRVSASKEPNLTSPL